MGNLFEILEAACHNFTNLVCNALFPRGLLFFRESFQPLDTEY